MNINDDIENIMIGFDNDDVSIIIMVLNILN